MTSVEEVAQQWERRASSFGKWEVVTQQAAKSIHEHLKLDDSSAIIECGAGRGTGSLSMLQRVSPQTRVIITDIASNMILIAREALTKAKLTNENVQVMQANALDLTNFADASFDRYVSNLCLHLVPDADKMLQEARRVLKPGALAGFTIFGRKSKCPLIAEMPKSLVEAGIIPSDEAPKVSPFTLGEDREALMERFYKAGFRQTKIWPVYCIMEMWNADAVVQLHETGINAELLRYSPTEHVAKWRQILRNSFNALLESGAPIGVECYAIITRVPTDVAEQTKL